MNDNSEAHPHHISHGKVAVIVIVLAMIVIGAWLVGYLPRRDRENAAKAAASQEKNSVPAVTAVNVHKAPADVDLSLPGSISSIAEASIYARAAGYVSKRFVDIGDHVKVDQLLAQIVAPDLDQQVAQARGAVAQAQQQLAQARSTLAQNEAQRDLAQSLSTRYRGLVANGAVAIQDAETQETAYKSAVAVVAAQEATVRANQENVAQAQANLDRVIALQEFKNVRSPIDGVVTARNVDVGYLISSTGGSLGASPSTQPGAALNGANGNEMFRVSQTGTLRIYVSVPQSAASSISVGMPAAIMLADLPGHEFSGKVAHISGAFDPATRTLLTDIQLSNEGGRLRPGMFATVRLKSHRDVPPLLVRGDTLIVNASGVSAAVLTDAGKGNGEKVVHLKKVQIARDYGAETEITSGLEAGDLVVVNPSDEVREGAFVNAVIQNAPGAAGAGGGSGAPRPAGR